MGLLPAGPCSRLTVVACAFPSPQVDRRAVLGGLAAAAAISTAAPSEAAYGDAARVFAGSITNKSGALRSRSVSVLPRNPEHASA